MREGVTSDIIDQLHSLIDDVADAPVPGRVGERIEGLLQVITRLDALVATDIATFDRNVEYTLAHARSTAGWLTRRCRLAGGDAHRLVRRAKQVSQMPVVGPLWLAGLINTRNVDQLTVARKHARADEQFAELEARFAKTARDERPEQLATELRQWRDALDAERADPDRGDGQDWESRRLHSTELLDGIGVIDARLDRESFAYFQRAIETELEKLRHADDARTPAQQRADALTSICRQYLAGQLGGSNRAHVMFLTDIDTYLGESVGDCETDRGVRIKPEAVRRIACDALLSRVILDADGHVLDMGRAVHNFTPAQYRALIVEYPCCVFPGCTVPSSDCQMHHIQHWEHDGPTDLANGAPLCWVHHRYVHEGKWTIHRQEDHRIDSYRPDGTHHGRNTPRRRPEPIPITQPDRPPDRPVPRPEPADYLPDIIHPDQRLQIELIGYPTAA